MKIFKSKVNKTNFFKGEKSIGYSFLTLLTFSTAYCSSFSTLLKKSNLKNYYFYKNEMKYEPNGEYIDEILKTWNGKYTLLENKHDYIQWLFPIYESSAFNSFSSPLNKEERELIIKDEDCLNRLIESYKMMLNFYGLRVFFCFFFFLCLFFFIFSSFFVHFCFSF